MALPSFCQCDFPGQRRWPGSPWLTTYLKRMGIERGEYYVLLLFSIRGMMLMA